MKKLVFYGRGDRLLQIAGDEWKEFSAEQGAAVLRLFSDSGQMLVLSLFAPKPVHAPVWSIGIAPVDENTHIPLWPMRILLTGVRDSAALCIDCPDDTEVSLYREEAVAG